MDTATRDTLIKDISDRVAAQIGETLGEARVLALIEENLPALLEKPEFVRKMRFGKGDPELFGTKYSRWGLEAADVEWLYDVMVSQAGKPRQDTGTHPGPSEELTRSFKAISDAYYLSEEEAKAIDKRALDNLFSRIPKSQFDDARGWAVAKARAVRAMDTAESGFGQQLIGAQYVRDLWEVSRMESRIAALFNSFEMTDPTVYIPVEVDVPEMLWVGENTANNSSEYTTVKTGSNRVQVDAKKFVIHQMYSGEMEEDAIIPYIPFLRVQAADGVAHYLDSLILNGDTTNAATGNINLDDADPADTKHYLALDGIRHSALVDNTANALNVGGALTLATMDSLLALMMDDTNLVNWGSPTNMDDVVFIADPRTARKAALLDEVLQWRIARAGGEALLNGEVGRVIGHPIISSMAMKLTEADGKVSTTAANNTLGQIAAVNRRFGRIGWRRRVKVETERLPGRDQTRIIYSLRVGFGRFFPGGAASGIEGVAVGYNITL